MGHAQIETLSPGRFSDEVGPDWSPLGVSFKICDENPRPFHMGVSLGDPYSFNKETTSIDHITFSKPFAISDKTDNTL